MVNQPCSLAGQLRVFLVQLFQLLHYRVEPLAGSMPVTIDTGLPRLGQELSISQVHLSRSRFSFLTCFCVCFPGSLAGLSGAGIEPLCCAGDDSRRRLSGGRSWWEWE